MELHNILIAFPQKGNNILIAIKKHNIINLFFSGTAENPDVVQHIIIILDAQFLFIHLSPWQDWMVVLLPAMNCVTVPYFQGSVVRLISTGA